MNKIILLTRDKGLNKYIYLDETEAVESFALIHGLDIHESENAELIDKILQIRTTIKSKIDAGEYEDAAALRDKEWQVVIGHFGCGQRLGSCSSAQIGMTIVYLTYKVI